jgi:transposase-like protein
MKRKRHTPTQIITKLRDAEAALAKGSNVAQACKQLSISEYTYYRWRQRYGKLSESEAKRLQELEKENTKLKKLVAEQAMDNATLKELLRKNW